MAGAWRNASRDCAVPLAKLQSHVLRLLAAGRSPGSYIAGGVAINREGPRFSGDIDIFQASENRLAAADRREPRDIVDLVTIHGSILPLGAVISAAVGRFPGAAAGRDAGRHQAPQPIHGGGISRPGDCAAH